MSNLDAVKNKIAAMLAKTELNGASETEAAAAMRIAAKLMNEHGVTLEDLRKETRSNFDFSASPANPEGTSKTLSILDRFVAPGIASYTDTRAWCEVTPDGFKRGKKGPKCKYSARVMFYGYSVDVELAKYIYAICDSALETEWKKFSVSLPSGVRAKARVAFQIGMAERLHERLVSIKEEYAETAAGKSLIILKCQLVLSSFQEAVKGIKQVPGSIVPYNDYEGVREAGQEAGDKVNFNREVQAGPTGGVRMITA